jgi:hypothetical protein
MAEPIDSAWSSTTLSDTNLNSTTYGQGTSFPSTWLTSRLFWRSDLKELYQNTGTEGSPIWHNLVAGSAGNTIVLKHSTTIGDYAVPTFAGESSEGVGTGNTVYKVATDTTTTVPLVDTYYATLHPSTANQADQDNTTSSNIYTVSNSSAYRDNGYATWDFGTNGGYAVKITQKIDETNVGNGVMQWAHSTDDSSYTDFSASPTSTLTETDYAIGSFRYLRYTQNSDDGSLWIANHIYQVTRLTATTTIDYSYYRLVDEDTGEYWISTAETNPFCYVNMNASTKVAGIAIWYESDTTETEIKIQTSPDNSTYTDKRTISTSNLTADAWNFIRITPTTCQYVRIYGSSGVSKVLAIGEIKVLSGVTDDMILNTHEHLDIDTTSTAIGLDGTA